MGTMLDYLDWYGDFDLETLPFNEADALVLCQLSYLDLFGSVPTDGKAIRMAEVSKRYFGARCAEEVYKADGATSRLTPFVLQKAAESKRFANARLSCYEARFDDHLNLRFAAVCVELDDGTVYVAFRGTENALESWRETFEMSFSATPSHSDALAYLNTVAHRFAGRLLRVGGYAKGGNLAVYASALCDADVQGRIVEIHDNDGPGFAENVLPEASLEAVRERIARIVPENCVAGALFNDASLDAVVQVDELDSKGRSALSWNVKGKALVRAETLDTDAARLNRSLAQWEERVPPDRRGEFAGRIFDALEAAGATTVSELAESDPIALNRLDEAMESLEPINRRVAGDLLAALAGRARQAQSPPLAELSNTLFDALLDEPEDDEPSMEGMRLWRRRDKLKKRRFSVSTAAKKLREHGLLRGVLLLAAGIGIIGNADSPYPVVPLVLVGAAAAYAVFLLVRYFKTRKRHERADPVDAAVGFALVGIAALFAVFQGALTVFFNLFVGGALLAYGLVLARRLVKDSAQGKHDKAVVGIWCAVAIPLGVATLANPSHQIAPLMIMVGLFAMAKGLLDIVRAPRASARSRKEEAERAVGETR